MEESGERTPLLSSTSGPRGPAFGSQLIVRMQELADAQVQDKQELKQEFLDRQQKLRDELAEAQQAREADLQEKLLNAHVKLAEAEAERAKSEAERAKSEAAFRQELREAARALDMRDAMHRAKQEEREAEFARQIAQAGQQGGRQTELSEGIMARLEEATKQWLQVKQSHAEEKQNNIALRRDHDALSEEYSEHRVKTEEEIFRISSKLEDLQSWALSQVGFVLCRDCFRSNGGLKRL